MIVDTPVEQLAWEFLVEDLKIEECDREFFEILSSRLTQQDGFIVEIGIEGLPDKWIIQVLDIGQCDPCYTFASPISAQESDTGLENYSLAIADIIAKERRAKGVKP